MKKNRDFTKIHDQELLGMKVAVHTISQSRTSTHIKKIVRVYEDCFCVEEDIDNPYKKTDGSITKPMQYFEEFCYKVSKKEAKKIKKAYKNSIIKTPVHKVVLKRTK